MKTKYLSGLLVVAAVLTVITGISFASRVSGGVKGNALEVESTIEDFYDFTLNWEGDTFSQYGVAHVWKGDTYEMTLTTTLKITIIVADCCIMWDTIGIYYPPGYLYASATSPDIITGTATLGPGTYTFEVGYEATPGGANAGYWIWVIATHA